MRTSKWAALGLTAGLALASPPSRSASAETTVSGPRRMETPIEQIAGSVTVISRDEIERRGWRTLSDALTEVPGLHVVQSGGIGGSTSLFLRGTESNHTLVLLDGIEISDPSLPGTIYDPALLTTEGLERIEVVRGPHSTLYGSDALGGVINLVSRRSVGKPAAGAWYEYGSFHTSQYAARASGAWNGADLSLGFTELHSRGIGGVAEELGGSDREGYDNRTLSGRFELGRGGPAGLLLSGRFVDTDRQIDAFSEDPDARSSARQVFARAEGRLDLFGERWQQRLGFAVTDHDRKDVNEVHPGSLSREKSTNDGTRLKLDWLHHLRIADEQVLTIGLEGERESLDARALGAGDGFTSASGANETVDNRAVFAQQQFALFDQVYGSVGGRLDDHEDFGSELTYHASAAWVLPATGTRLHGAVATGFKAPSLTDLYGSSVFDFGGFLSLFVGNPELEPERSRSFEIGIRHPLLGGRVQVGSTWFQTRIRNLIESRDFTTLENVARARIHGLETFASVTLDRVSARIDHTYTSAEDRSSGEELLRRPSHVLSAKLEVAPIDRASLSAAVVYTGHRKDIDARSFGRVSKGGYTTVDLAGTLELRPGVEVFARIDNLFDREYGDPDGFESSPRAGFVGIRTGF